MRWWGLYTQRKPGIDGGKTATLAPEELDDEFFMMRIRSDGGALTNEQLRVIAGISTEFARDTADISDRQNIQLHWIRVEDVPEIWRRLEAVGLTTAEACGDTPRVILGSPVAGIAANEIVDGTPAVREILANYIGSPEFSNLPRKFKTAISGSPNLDVAHEVNDVSFVGVVHPEHGPGFDVWVAGGLSTNPMFAQRLGAWVPLDEVPEVWKGVVSIFRDYGYRRLRNRARLKFLMADWGPEKFRQVLETEYLGRAPDRRPRPRTPPTAAPRPRRRQPAGRRHLLGGRRAHRRPRLGHPAHPHRGPRRPARLRPRSAHPPPEAARPRRARRRRRGSRRGARRRGPARAAVGVPPRRDGLHRHRVLQAGARGDQGAGALVVEELEARLPEFDVPFTIHVNGCPNACARTQVADVGLKGMVQSDADGNLVELFQVHLGGGLGATPQLARKTRALKVAAADLPDYIERLARTFLAHREADEPFAQWAHRADEDLLR